ncbi:radical SAM protein [Streptomyces sp. NPDC002690]
MSYADASRTEIQPDRTARLKIIDACGMACQFCHNEGTPVTSDNKGRSPQEYTGTPGRTGRVAIYTATNSSSFLADRIDPGPDFANALTVLRDRLDTTNLHFTGGEPTLHPALDSLVAQAVRRGFTLNITSNGENGAAVMKDCAKAGLKRINLSVFGTTATELAAVQAERFNSERLAQRKLDALDATIEAAFTHGVKASANLVVAGPDQIPRALHIARHYGARVTVRLLLNLETAQASREAIMATLGELGAEPDLRIVAAGASNVQTRYLLPDGRRIYAKGIDTVRLPTTCTGCLFNTPEACQEGYYGIRMYKAVNGPYMLGVCIRRMDLCQPLHAFVNSSLADEVRGLRQDELARLVALHPGAAVAH